MSKITLKITPHFFEGISRCGRVTESSVISLAMCAYRMCCSICNVFYPLLFWGTKLTFTESLALTNITYYVGFVRDMAEKKINVSGFKWKIKIKVRQSENNFILF